MRKLVFTALAAMVIVAAGAPQLCRADGPLPDVVFNDNGVYYTLFCSGTTDCCCISGDSATGGGGACSGLMRLSQSRGDDRCWTILCSPSSPDDSASVRCVHQP
jgi:hypothetical protein